MRREKIAPADVLFRPATRPEPPATPKHVKVTVYMPPEMVAELDEKRAEMRRNGTSVDRGRLVRAAIRLSQVRSGEWLSETREEEN